MFNGEETKIDATTGLIKNDVLDVACDNIQKDILKEFSGNIDAKELNDLVLNKTVLDSSCDGTQNELAENMDVEKAECSSDYLENDLKHSATNNNESSIELNIMPDPENEECKSLTTDICINAGEIEEVTINDSQQSLQLWKCPKCAALFCDKTTCSQHFDEAHNFVCGLCKEPCDDKTSLELHIIDHIALEPGEPLQKIKKTTFIDSYAQTDLLVEECAQSSDVSTRYTKKNTAQFDTILNMSKLEHVGVESNSASDDDVEFLLEKEEPQNKCEVCENNFFSESALLLHLKSKHEDMPIKRVHRCEKCGMLFQWKFCLTRHKILKHNDVKQKLKFRCKLCSDVFPSQKDFMNHQKTHSDDYPFICDFCDQKFSCSAKHLQHIKSFHPHSREFPCTVCGKSFKSKTFLNAHTLEVHSSRGTDKCQLCKKVCKSPMALEQHMFLDHSTERKQLFTCEYCGKRFPKSGLMMHIKSVHKYAN